MPLTFRDLLNAYPAENNPCSNAAGQPYFNNQCAIRMGICLADAEVDLTTCHAVRCWHGHGRRHILRAQELADWMAARERERIFGSVQRQRRTTYHAYNGRNGIVFFRNFWGQGNQGDHIDLWDGLTCTAISGARDYFTRSQEVWFWSIG